MPIPYKGSYTKLREVAKKGVGLGGDVACPRPGCGSVGQLRFLGTWVDRDVVWLRGKRGVHEKTTVPLARCGGCKGRFRVLPEEMVPFKLYSFPLIERCVKAYVVDSTKGLQEAAKVVEGVQPHHTALHGWVGGIGDRVLEREKKNGAQRKQIPASAIVIETSKRLGPNPVNRWHEDVKIPSWKYETEERRDQLMGCAKLLNMGSFLFKRSLHPVSAWHGWVVSELDVAGWTFWSRGRCTTFQIEEETGGRVASVQGKKQRKRESTNGSRSPPSGMLAF